MLCSAYALGTRTLFGFQHRCFDQYMHWERERYYGLGMDALVSKCSGNVKVVMVWAWMIWSAYERYYGLGKHALVSICSGNTNAMV